MILIVANRLSIATDLAEERGIDPADWVWVTPAVAEIYINQCAQFGVWFDRKLSRIGKVTTDTDLTTEPERRAS